MQGFRLGVPSPLAEILKLRTQRGIAR